MPQQITGSLSSVFSPQWCFFAAHLLGASALLCGVSACGPDETILEPYLSCDAPQILGHRGTRKGAPENTLPAFDWAMKNGGDGIEVDVKRTQDGVLVAFHDKTTGRTTDDADDRKVSSLGFGQLRLLDAGGWFGDACSDTKVPTLQEVVRVVPAHAQIDIDHLTKDVVDDVADFIEANGITDRALVSSYDQEALGLAAERMPDVRRVLFLGDVGIDALADEIEEQAAIAKPDIIRIPKNIDEDPRALLTVLEAGYQPAASGMKIQWVGGIVYADNVSTTRDRLEDRRPPWCEVR